MELVEVKILGLAMTSRYGTLNSGDILRTDAAFAKHLIEDCAVAEYTRDLATKGEPVAAAAAPTRNKRRTPAEMAAAEEAAAAEKVAAEAAKPTDPAEQAPIDPVAADAGKSAELPL